jgi:hypothetical protein
MRNYYKLKVPFEFLKSNIEIPSFNNDFYWHWLHANGNEYITSEGLDFLRSLNVIDLECQIFRGKPNEESLIHIDRRIMSDGSYRGRSWALNYIWNCNNSEMRWYKERNSGTFVDSFNSNKEVKFNVFEQNDVELIESVNLVNEIVLVRIEVPHSVCNHDAENSRYCFSIRDKTNRWSWEEAIEKFKPWSVE